MAFIHRSVIRTISGLLPDHAIVLVEGPPRCGKSTMARQLAASAPAGSVLVDARLREGRAILSAPGSQSAARPIILDNAGRLAAEQLLSWISSAAMPGNENEGEGSSTPRLPRFILVGGPFGELEQPEESTGDRPRPGDRPGCRVARVRMGPLSLFEAGRAALRRLWLRGGYPEAFGAASDETAAGWLEGYTADLAHGALADWSLPREPALITALLEMVAFNNGMSFNEHTAALALGLSRPTIVRYLGILEKAGILFQVPGLPPGLLQKIGSQEGSVPQGSVPKHINANTSRAIKSSVLYIGDSGLLHALLGVRSADELMLKPGLAAASWAGFVAGQVRQALPTGTSLYRYASADGAALDLVVVRENRPVLVAAARRHRPASVERSISYAAKTVGSDPGRFIVVPEDDERALPGGFAVVGLGAFLERVAINP